VLLAAVIIGGAYAGWRYTQDQYYVGTDGTNVAIFQGVNETVAGVRLSHVYQHTDIPLAEVPTTDQATIRATIDSSSGLAGARSILNNIRSSFEACRTAIHSHAVYQQEVTAYNAAKASYLKKHHNLKPVVVKHKVKASPPKPPTAPAPIPPNCPTSATGSGGSS
jgi:protein phosphatase